MFINTIANQNWKPKQQFGSLIWSESNLINIKLSSGNEQSHIIFNYESIITSSIAEIKKPYSIYHKVFGVLSTSVHIMIKNHIVICGERLVLVGLLPEPFSHVFYRHYLSYGIHHIHPEIGQLDIKKDKRFCFGVYGLSKNAFLMIYTQFHNIIVDAIYLHKYIDLMFSWHKSTETEELLFTLSFPKDIISLSFLYRQNLMRYNILLYVQKFMISPIHNFIKYFLPIEMYGVFLNGKIGVFLVLMALSFYIILAYSIDKKWTINMFMVNSIYNFQLFPLTILSIYKYLVMSIVLIIALIYHQYVPFRM